MFAALVATRVFFWWSTDTGVAKKLSFWSLIPENAIDFMGKRKASLTASLVILVASLGVMGTKQSSMLGIDFVGGTQISFQLGDTDVPVADVDKSLSDITLTKAHLASAEVIPDTGELLSISCATEDKEMVIAELRKDIPALVDIDYDLDVVGPTLGKEFLINSLTALGLGLVAILLYITVRFEFSFAVGAFAALVHDLVICLGIIVATGTELSLIHVGAVLTILGYSINDTIVVFDRIREVLQIKRGKVADIMNFAINSTLSRTLLTSVTTFAVVLVLYIYGGPSLKDFSFAIMIGVVVGTYSSIFVASPVVLIWSEKRGSNLRRELLDANLESGFDTSKG
jgi:SecD/SecF fusion protein